MAAIKHSLLKDPKGKKKAKRNLKDAIAAAASKMVNQNSRMFMEPAFLAKGNCSAGPRADEIHAQLRSQLLANNQQIDSNPSPSSKIIHMAVTPGKDNWNFEIREANGRVLASISAPSMLMSGSETTCVNDSSHGIPSPTTTSPWISTLSIRDCWERNKRFIPSGTHFQ